MADPALERSQQAGHEVTDADAVPLARVGIGIAIFLALVFVGIIVLFKVFSYYQPLLHSAPHPLAETRQVSPERRIQVDPPRQKIELNQQEDQVLTTYEWVDEEEKIVHIPIDRAIALVAAKGL